MKYKELKNKFQNKYVIRVAAGVLTIALLGTGVGMYSIRVKAVNENRIETTQTGKETEDLSEAEEEEKETVLTEVLNSQVDKGTSQAGKEETVYVVADASGVEKSVIVSEWLKNPEGAKQLVDATDLKDVTNVKGEEAYTENSDGTITWQADGNDIYYQGTTDKELPIDMKITYTLDGKKVSADEIAGKSGKVTIRMDYTNKETVKTTIDGKQEEVVVPFTAISGMILTDDFTNVQVTNGKVISDGKNQVVVGIAMPGMKDSLDVESKDFDTDVEIPEYVEVSADVEDFSLDMTMTLLMSDVLADLQLQDSLDLSELEDSIDTLSDASTQLVDGSGELAEGLDTLRNSMDDYASGVNSLKDGVDAYTTGVSQVKDGIDQLKDRSGALVTGANDLSAGVNQISESFTSEKGLVNGAAALEAGVNQLNSALKENMTEEEKLQIAEQAAAAVEKSFEEGMAAEIAQQASNSFTETMKAGSERIGEQLCSSELYTTMVEALYQQKIFEAYQAQKATVDAAIDQYAAVGQTVTITDVVEAAYQAQVGHSIKSEVEAGVAATLKDTVAPQIADGIATNGSSAMGESVAAACEEAAKQAAGTAVVSGAEGTKAQIAAQIEEGGLISGVKALSDGVEQLYKEGISPLKAGVDSMITQMPTLTEGIGKLVSGSTELTANNNTLTDGAAKLSDATAKLTDGVNQLEEGSNELNDGMVEFDEEGIQKLADAYHGDVKQLMDRVETVIDAGEAYQTFAGKAETVTGSVKFIIRTEAVKAE